MKKILVLSASPRRNGNSSILCDEFIRGAQTNGNDVEKIYVNQLNIKHCQACYACRNTGKCFQKDDMENIINKMIAADIIVLASPVYFYSMNGQLKTLIDRTLPSYTKIKNKDFYFIATAADEKEMIERTIDSMRGFTDCLPGAKVKGVVYGYGVYQIGDVKSTDIMKEAYNLGVNA